MIDGRRLFRNSLFLFTGSRYLGYALLFIRGMLVARYMGPAAYGIWGFVTLALQYLQYTSLGVPYAVNVELATGSKDRARQDGIVSSAFSVTTFVVGIVIVAGLVVWLGPIHVFEKYEFHRYAAAVALLAGLSHYQQLLTNVYRIHRNLARIAACELLTAVVPFLALVFFKDDAIIRGLLIFMIASGAAGLAIYLTRPPFKISLSFRVGAVWPLLSIGIPLLIYNLSFYLVAMTGRTIVGIAYPVETMGYYTLATAITTATLLGLEAVAWVVFPDLLSRMREGVPDADVVRLLTRINNIYTTAVFLMVFVLVPTVPLLFIFLPAYKPSEGVLDVLLMAEGVLSVAFAYNCLAVARRRQLAVAVASFAGLAIAAAAGTLAAIAHLSFVWISIAVLLAISVYVVLQARIGVRVLPPSVRNLKRQPLVPWAGKILAVILVVTGSLARKAPLFGSAALLLFAATNHRQLAELLEFISQKVRRRNTSNEAASV
jgi:O-antigen/teichoic acid export membrane protein